MINDRLNQILVNGKPIISNAEIATTFHAFARTIVYSICKEDQKYGKILVEDRTRFIQAIIKELPKYKIYAFFRSEAFQIKRDKFANEREYYDALRNAKYETLDGKIVKSEAEKIICDFLFEREIKYFYENEYYLSGARNICHRAQLARLLQLRDKFKQEAIKPDFYLQDYKLPWEHWAITGKEDIFKQREINRSGVIGDYDDYKNKMLWKKWFYAREWLDDTLPVTNKYALQIKQFRGFIETYKPDHCTRAEFEEYLTEVLTSKGIPCQKLPEDELINKVWNSQVNRFSKMITQFIDRAEQQFSSDENLLTEKIKSYKADLRTKAFLEMGHKTYQNYLAYLAGELPKQNLLTKIIRNNKEEILDFRRYGIDFNMLIKRATELLNDSNQDNLREFLCNRKYILIDEYQDFSQLFLQLICAVRRKCPLAKLFVVGDDWQAINRFAGSDVSYFHNFKKIFPADCCTLDITTNYRCDRKIVDQASTFIHNTLHERGDFVARSKNDGLVAALDPKTVAIEYSADDYDKDAIFKQNMKVANGRNPSKAAVQYLKIITQIIAKNAASDSILLLHRNNDTSFWYIDLASLYERIKKTIVTLKIMSANEFEAKVQIMTMHKAKGLEADTVIILEADEGIIPSYHQDTQLFEIFGETPEIALNDQKRLFYVALTRARHRLYILHNHQKDARKNGFINDLN